MIHVLFFRLERPPAAYITIRKVMSHSIYADAVAWPRRIWAPVDTCSSVDAHITLFLCASSERYHAIIFFGRRSVRLRSRDHLLLASTTSLQIGSPTATRNCCESPGEVSVGVVVVSRLLCALLVQRVAHLTDSALATTNAIRWRLCWWWCFHVFLSGCVWDYFVI